MEPEREQIMVGCVGGGVGSLETYTDFWPSCHQKVKGMLLKSCAPWQKAREFIYLMMINVPTWLFEATRTSHGPD